MKGEEVFLSVDEISRLIDRGISVVKAGCADGTYLTRKVPSRGKTGWKYEIALSSLPVEARQKYLGQQTAAKLSPPQSEEVRPATSPVALPCMFCSESSHGETHHKGLMKR
jgi:hypothetical protein